MYAQVSVLPPSPSVDETVSEQLSLNVARFAYATLQEINEGKSNEEQPLLERQQEPVHEDVQEINEETD